jgi:hypothetical protein
LILVVEGFKVLPPRLATLIELADLLRLPADWLREEALAGRIPCLPVHGKLRFNPQAVEQTLASRAATSLATRQEVALGAE